MNIPREFDEANRKDRIIRNNKMKVEQDHFMKSKKERNLLYILVDIVWSAANKDESEPSIDHATELIKRAKEQYDNQLKK